MPGRATSTSFKKGCAPGPGRPKGFKDRLPRGSLKAVVQELIEKHRGHNTMLTALKASLGDKKQRLWALELIGKVGKEIGSGAEVMAPTVDVYLQSNVEPQKLRDPV
jgi:hypothetical protein